MEFGVLGPMRVSRDDGALDLGGPRERAFLAVLLSSPNRPVPDDRLADEVWAGDPPPSAHHVLQVYASRLRQTLGEPDGRDRILRSGAGYSAVVDPGELDAATFLDLVTAGLDLGEADPGRADDAFEQAMRLWRDVPFADLTDPPPAVRERATYLLQVHRQAVDAWAEARLRLGRHRELVPDLVALSAAEPFDEAVHAHLMLALYRSGRQAEALETGRALTDRLRRELGVEPSSQVRSLYRRILLQDPGLAADALPPPGNLPGVLTSFVGRTQDADDIAGLLETCRLVTLTGTGGIGKTRLALEVARREQTRFPDGVWWVDLAQTSDPDAVVDLVATAVGAGAPPGAPVLGAVTLALRPRRALVLLDNCEHVAGAVATVVREILGATSVPRLLTTSRVPLGVEGERLYVVPPLPLPEARRLFVERGRLVRPAFELGPANAAAVTEVCRRLDGLSLAVEMAAARLRVLTPEEIARHLDERFALLEFASADRLTRHRTMEAAIDASYDLLTDGQRVAFERLAVFAGSFDLDAAAALAAPGPADAAAGLAVVSGLVDASLLTARQVDGRTRYRLLETLRAYAAAHLHVSGGTEDARRTHTRHYLDLATRAGEVIGTPAFAPWVDRLAGDYRELQQALEWSLDHEDRAATLRVAPALNEYWMWRGDAGEALRWSARMLRGDLSEVPPALLAAVHNAASMGATLAMDLEGATWHSEQAIALAAAAGHPVELVLCLFGRSHVAFASGDLVTMERYADEALAVCDRAGDRWGRGRALSARGYARLFAGDVAEARAALEEGVPLLRELGSTGDLVLSGLVPLCVVALAQQDLVAADRYASEAVEQAAGTAWLAAALGQYAMVLNARAEPDAAEAAARRGLRVALDAGMGQWVRMSLRELARAAAGQGRPEEAARFYGASRHQAPASILDPAVYGPLETSCRAALGDERFDHLAAEGAALTLDEISELAPAG